MKIFGECAQFMVVDDHLVWYELVYLDVSVLGHITKCIDKNDLDWYIVMISTIEASQITVLSIVMFLLPINSTLLQYRLNIVFQSNMKQWKRDDYEISFHSSGDIMPNQFPS